MKKIVINLIAFLLATTVSAALFLAIPVSNYLRLQDTDKPDKVEVEMVTAAKIPKQKKKDPPKKKSMPKKVKKSIRSTPKMARQQVAMDLGPGGGGENAATIAMGGGNMGQMAYQEGETDSDVQLISGPAPKYPSEAEKMGIHGLVEVELTIGENGKVADYKIVQSPGDYGFAQSIAKTLEKWKFQPAMLDGIPVRQKILQPFEF